MAIDYERWRKSKNWAPLSAIGKDIQTGAPLGIGQANVEVPGLRAYGQASMLARDLGKFMDAKRAAQSTDTNQAQVNVVPPMRNVPLPGQSTEEPAVTQQASGPGGVPAMSAYERIRNDYARFSDPEAAEAFGAAQKKRQLEMTTGAMGRGTVAPSVMATARGELAGIIGSERAAEAAQKADVAKAEREAALAGVDINDPATVAKAVQDGVLSGDAGKALLTASVALKGQEAGITKTRMTAEAANQRALWREQGAAGRLASTLAGRMDYAMATGQVPGTPESQAALEENIRKAMAIEGAKDIRDVRRGVMMALAANLRSWDPRDQQSVIDDALTAMDKVERTVSPTMMQGAPQLEAGLYPEAGAPAVPTDGAAPEQAPAPQGEAPAGETPVTPETQGMDLDKSGGISRDEQLYEFLMNALKTKDEATGMPLNPDTGKPMTNLEQKMAREKSTQLYESITKRRAEKISA